MATEHVATLAEVKLAAFDRALAAVGGHRVEAAKILKVSVKTVYNVIARHPDLAEKYPAPPRADQAQTTPVSS